VLDLINQILEVARLEAGRAQLHARRLDIGAFLQNLANSFAAFAERKQLTFEVQIPSEPIVLYADADQLQKVLSNLLSNAFKFTPAGGSVRVSVQTDSESCRIAVRDSGQGIPASELTRVFERFYRVRGSSGPAQPGTGIGLALAKELVELHGGTLTVQSEEGFGSTFTVTLLRGHAHLAPDQIDVTDDVRPLAPAPVTLPPVPGPAVDLEPQEADSDVDVTTVLVVEDNAEVRSYIRKHLAPTYRVLEAVDGHQGLEMTRRLLPDLVLSDVMMPGMDGYALCRALKNDAETDFIPVILLTARAATEDRYAGLQEHADDYLTKPFDVNELLLRVENLIDARKRMRERFAGAALVLHPTAVQVAPPEEKFLDQVRTVIEENLGDEAFSVERLARKVAHSRGHLHRRLRELLNESPSDLIRRMRLERAAQLLEARSGGVSEIAYAVGFKSVAHFSNSFQEKFGVRPSGYRAERARPTGVAEPPTG
jgi:CheY-like chemotaxis protein/AraC-like DNA-binding protein/two-component sensor histidine kinase